VANKKSSYIYDANGNIMATYATRGGVWLWQSQHASTTLSNHLYGAERLGILQVIDEIVSEDPAASVTAVNTLLDANGYTTHDDGPRPFQVFHTFRGEKQYEITNHLGNVMVVVKEQPLTLVNNGVFQLADVVSATDYYPFGLQMPERVYEAGRYGFGFNTQMESPEILAGHTTAMYWEYDARIGRRWELDPVAKPNLSPYSAFSGNPILKIDFLGDDDYYNYAGIWLGSDGVGSEIRLIPTRNQFEGRMKSGGEKELKANSRIIKMPDEATIKATFDMIYNESVSLCIERKAYLVLNTKTAEIEIQIQPQDPKDTDRGCQNNWIVGSVDGDKVKFPQFNGKPSYIIIGQVHAHPGCAIGVNETQVPGVSDKDVIAASDMGDNIYAINIDRVFCVDENGTKDHTVVPPSPSQPNYTTHGGRDRTVLGSYSDILKESLNNHSKKP
jgi:hypothetical protein